MKESKAGGKRRELTPLGWILTLGGMLLAALVYVLLDIGQFFAGFEGLLGLDEMAWTVIGGVIWILVIMAILTPIALKVGSRE